MENGSNVKDFYFQLVGNVNVDVVKFFDVFFNNNMMKYFYMNPQKNYNNCAVQHQKYQKVARTYPKSPALRKYSSFFVKHAAECVALILCYQVNLLIKQSLFLDQCTIAKLKPLFEKVFESHSKITGPSCYLVFARELRKVSSFRDTNVSLSFCHEQCTSLILRGMESIFRLV